MVDGRVRADHDDDVGMTAFVERGRDRARADALEQRRDGRGVAQPGAMVDVVGAKARAHQLLDQVGLLVRALRRAEARERRGAVALENPAQARSRDVEGLVPARFAEVGVGVGRVEIEGCGFGRVVAPDQRRGQAVGMTHIVEAEAALDAEPAVIGRAVAAFDPDDGVVLDLEGELAADPAIGADAVDRLLPPRRRPRRGAGIRAPVGQACTHSPQATQLLAPHRIVEIEHDLVARTPVRHADDVVDLNLAARAPRTACSGCRRRD